MTILGKILVILNLVFALVVGGLVVVVYSRNTNWQTAFERQRDAYEAARLAADQSAKDLVEAREREKHFQSEVENRLKEEDKARKDLETQVANAKDELDKTKKALADKQREIVVALDDVNRIKNEKDLLEANMKQRDIDNARLLAQYNSLNQEATTAKLLVETLRDRTLSLAKLVKQYEDIIKKGGVTTVSNTGTPAPSYPPTNVEGLVTKVDDQSRLLSISVGGDSGIEKDQTLDVWRIEGNRPNYLGTIHIMDVRAKEAVARPDRDRVQLKVGDHVGRIGG